MAKTSDMPDARQAPADDAFSDREFPMSDSNYSRISKLSYDQSGIVFDQHKQPMVYSRLSRRLRQLNQSNFDVYLKYLDSHWDTERTHFLNALTTNLTSFFREAYHFDYLADVIIPELRKRHATDKRVRIWSAASSTGEEPYSIAMVFREAMPGLDWDIKILATDLDSNVLDTAQRAIYSVDRLEDMDPKRIRRWFTQIDSGHYQVKEKVRSLLTFNQLNLLHNWPIHGPFDVVFCRNVIIYFDLDTQRTLFKKIHRIMAPDSHLIIGHSENLINVSSDFESMRRNVFRRLEIKL